MGWLEVRNGGADGGGWHTSDLHLQRITHRHLTRRTSTSSAIRAIERLGCAGGALEVRASVNAGVLKDQRHRRLSSALPAPAPGCAASRCATRGQLLRGDERGNGRLRLGHARSASVHGSCATVWTVRSNPIPSEHRPVHARRAIQPRLAVDRTCSRLAPSPPESRHRSGRTAWLLAVDDDLAT